jgi:DNA-directed RNA polymerase subunit F
MLKKVYLSESIEDSLFEIRKDFKDIDLRYCTDLSFDQFIHLHQPNLLNNFKVTGFVGVEKYNSDLLVGVLDSDIQVDVVWIIGKLDKRKKFYKKIKKNISIEECKDLSAKKAKKAFIKKIFQEFNVSTKYLEYFLKVSSDSKQSIYNEIRKFSKVVSILPEEEALRSISVYNANFDVLDFISAVFSGNIDDSYLFAKKIENVPIPVVRATLIKRLNSYIALSAGNLDQAKKYWDRNGYYVNQDMLVSNKYGFENLLEITNYVDKVFGNFLNSDNSFLRFTKLMDFIQERRVY